MKQLAGVLAAAVLAGLVILAPVAIASGGLGAGGLQGFPPATPVNGATVSPDTVNANVINVASLDGGVSQFTKLAATVTFDVGNVHVTTSNIQVPVQGAYFLDGTSHNVGTLYDGSNYVQNFGKPWWFDTGIAFGASAASKAVTTVVPTISSGFGSSPSIVSSNGSAAFQVNVGTGGVATSGVISFTTAVATGWTCHCDDITTPGANRTRMTANSTTTCTVTNVAMSTGSAAAWTASDKLWCTAMGQ